MLIARFQEGDHRAMDALIHKHEKRAYQFAFRMTRDEDLAADVVAESFTRLFRALPRFKGESAFTTWMFRILANCFFDIRRKEALRGHLSLDANTHTEDGEVEVQLVDPSDSPHVEAEQNELARIICAAMRDMVPKQRAMISMFHIEMLSYEEIAQTLDLPIGTIKSRMHRARYSLRLLLEDDKAMFCPAA